jgi:hypothetical protein
MPTTRKITEAVSENHVGALIAAVEAEDHVAVADLIALHELGHTDFEGFKRIAKYYTPELEV